MLGFALGCVGLSYDDFCRCTPEEFESICRAYREQREDDYKDDWERMRLLATICIQPHVKRKLQPKQLFSLPWEKGNKKKGPTESAAQSKARFEELIKRVGKKPTSNAGNRDS